MLSIVSLIVELFDSKVKLTNLPLDLDDVCATHGESVESSSDLIGRNCALIIGRHIMTIPIIEMNTHRTLCHVYLHSLRRVPVVVVCTIGSVLVIMLVINQLIIT